MSGPLSSLKVLDFSTLLPGPFASLLLADMGADVLRIESPTRMDLVRVLPPHADGVSASHAYLNRNKRCIALDLKQAEAVALVKQLVAEYDIVLEQFRPGVMDKLGVGYEALKAINPKLIYVSITGYGQTGPYKDRAGHDLNYLAVAGLAQQAEQAQAQVGQAQRARLQGFVQQFGAFAIRAAQIRLGHVRLDHRQVATLHHRLRLGVAACGIGRERGVGALGIGERARHLAGAQAAAGADFGARAVRGFRGQGVAADLLAVLVPAIDLLLRDRAAAAEQREADGSREDAMQVRHDGPLWRSRSVHAMP